MHPEKQFIADFVANNILLMLQKQKKEILKVDLKKIVLSSGNPYHNPVYNKNNNTSSPPCGPKVYLSEADAENIIYSSSKNAFSCMFTV